MSCELPIQRQRNPSFHERESVCPHRVEDLEGTHDLGVSNEQAPGLNTEIPARHGQQEGFFPGIESSNGCGVSGDG